MKANAQIKLGTIVIRRGQEFEDDSTGHAYTIFISDEDGNELQRRGVHSFNFDMVLLMALELKHEGINGNFATYAASMLNLDGELWV